MFAKYHIALLLLLCALSASLALQTEDPPTTPIPIVKGQFSFARGSMASDVVIDM